jgi:hypothetical protein
MGRIPGGQGAGGGAEFPRHPSPKFEFTGGKIVQVVFDVADETYADAETRLAALMARD